MWQRHSCLCQSVLLGKTSTGRSAGATRVTDLPHYMGITISVSPPLPPFLRVEGSPALLGIGRFRDAPSSYLERGMACRSHGRSSLAGAVSFRRNWLGVACEGAQNSQDHNIAASNTERKGKQYGKQYGRGGQDCSHV